MTAPATHVDLPPDPGTGDTAAHASSGGTLWHLVHAGVLDPDTTLTARRADDDAWHLDARCPHLNPATAPARDVSLAAVLTDVIDTTSPGWLCGCEQLPLLTLAALDAAGISALRFLADTDPLPTGPARARALRVRMRTIPPATGHRGLDNRVAARAALRWAQLAATTTDRTFQISAIDWLVADLQQRAPATLPVLWSAACSTWVGASDTDRATAGAEADVAYPHTRRGAIHDLVWAALTTDQVWIRSGPPADRVPELGIVLAEDDTHEFLRIPAAGHSNAHLLCTDDRYAAADVAAAARLRPSATGRDLADLIAALDAARTT